MYSFDASELRLLLRADSFMVSGVRKTPLGSSRLFLDASLSRNELRYLISTLTSAEDAMPDSGELLANEDRTANE